MMSVLLIILTVTAASFTAYTISQGWLSAILKSNVGLSSSFSDTLEDFVIEDVKLEYSGSNSYITIYVRNIGTEKLTISSAYFDGRKAEIVNSSQEVKKLVLKPQALGWLKLKLPYIVSKGELHEISLWSEKGKKVSKEIVF